jgi:hypothetical protein
MTDFPALTDEQINRWAAERDGFFDFWTTSDSTGTYLYGHVKSNKPHPWPQVLRTGIPDYATSADSALALLGRWGMEIADCLQTGDSFKVRLFINPIGNPPQNAHNGATFPRALLNAACAAKEAMEAKSDD